MNPWPRFKDVDRAAKACMKRKQGRPDAIAFRRHYGEEVFYLTKRLQSGTYRPESGTVFVTDRPKYREIHAAAFRDRVVHHLLHDQLEPLFEKSFIADSYACRVGKGTHAAAQALQMKMREITRQGKVRAYALKMDIRSFFPSIDKPTLLNLLKKGFKSVKHQEAIYSLLETVVNHNPVPSARPLGNSNRFSRVPEHKRLGAHGLERGLPIGNLTSQFFANVYLNALDHFVKCTLSVRHYLRYVDDFILLHSDPEQLRIWEASIRAFLAERLFLKAHEGTLIQPVSQGVDFVGYVIRPNYVLSRRRVLKQADKRITELERNLRPLQLKDCERWPIDSNAAEVLRATWASYFGHLKHSNFYRALQRLWQRHPISRLQLLSPISPKLRFSPFKIDLAWFEQVDRLKRGLKKTILIVKVGRYAEVPYWRDARRLGLAKAAPRKGIRSRVGVLYSRLQILLERAFKKGFPVALAIEVKESWGRLRARRLVCWMRPNKRNKK